MQKQMVNELFIRWTYSNNELHIWWHPTINTILSLIKMDKIFRSRLQINPSLSKAWLEIDLVSET